MRPRSVVGMRTTPSADTNNCSVRYRKVKIEKNGEEFNNIEIRVSDTVLYLYFLLTLGTTNLIYHKFSQTFD